MARNARSTAQKKSSSASGEWSAPIARGLEGGALIALAGVSLYLMLALMSYHASDPGWSYVGDSSVVRNLAGRSGAWLADVFLSIFGYLAYLFPIAIIARAIIVLRREKPQEHHWMLTTVRSVAFLVVIITGCALASIHFNVPATRVPESAGGIIGLQVGHWMLEAFNLVGSTLLLLALFLVGITVFANLHWLTILDRTGAIMMNGYERIRSLVIKRIQAYRAKQQAKEVQQARKATFETAKKQIEKRVPPKIEKTAKPIKPSVRVQKEKQQSLFSGATSGELPKLALLDAPDQDGKKGYSPESLEAMSRLLELKLKDFNVDAEVVAVQPGPVVTRFEIQPAPGVKVSKITNLAKDLARSLAVISVRVVEVIPGKTVVGIEIPNEHREMIRFSEVVSSQEFDESSSPLTLALGKDISGNPVVGDLAKMPHLLVAGTTGSGKSVGVNAMMLSILFKSSPEDVRLIMIDPKMLELAVYDGIPHLLTPVVTDMKEAASALRWSVAEMERRYRLMAALGVRNIAGYNRKVLEAKKKGEPIKDPLWQPTDDALSDEAPELDKLPYIVVVIDEFADMMMIVGKKVEELIARIAQKARAAGIHLILATQRPSVDVITGLIKANIPSRMAFQVSSKIDSRTVLDQGGAEQLLGHGDMLYMPAGTSLPERVHGAFVSDEEVHRVCDDWRSRGEPDYLEAVLDSGSIDAPIPGMGGEESGGDDPEQDALYDQAVHFVCSSRRASISSVQRKLKIGYNRAARLIEAMEAAGVVSPPAHNGSREVLAPPPVDA